MSGPTQNKKTTIKQNKKTNQHPLFRIVVKQTMATPTNHSIVAFLCAFLLFTLSHASTVRTRTSTNPKIFDSVNSFHASNSEILDTELLELLASSAQKYDCSTGEKDVETIIDEVSAKNKQAQETLEQHCQDTLDGLKITRTTAKTNADTYLVNATKDAKQMLKDSIAEVNNQYDTFEASHTTKVAVKRAAKEQVKANHTLASTLFEVAKNKYLATKTQLSTRETTEKQRAITEATRISSVQISTVENALSNQEEKISFANTTKIQNLNNCAATNTVRKNIILSDRESITKIKALQDKLAALKSRTSSVGTGTATSFLEIDTGLSDNFDEMLQQNLDTQKKWNATCETILSSYDESLMQQKNRAQSIRDNAKPKHTLTYDEEVDTANATFQVVYDVQENAVQTAQEDTKAKELTANSANKIFEEMRKKHSTAKQISEEETSGLQETKSQDEIRVNSNAEEELSRLLSVMNATTASALLRMTTHAGECLQSKNERSSYVEQDEQLVLEIQPLLSRLVACKQSTDTSLLELNAREQMEVQCANTQRRLVALKTTFSLLLEEKGVSGNINDWNEKLAQEKMDIANTFTKCTEVNNNTYASAMAEAREAYATDVLQTNNIRDKHHARIANTTTIKIAAINQKYSDVQIPYLNAQEIKREADEEWTTATAVETQAVETQKEQVKLANVQKTKAIGDALKQKNDSIESDKKTATGIVTDAKNSHKINTLAKEKECNEETVALKEEEVNLRNIVSELASIQATLSGPEQTKTVVVLKQKLVFKGVTAEALNTPETKAKIETELMKQLYVQAPSTLSITSIRNSLSSSFIETTASGGGVPRRRHSVEINYEIVAPVGQDTAKLEEKMKTLDKKKSIVEVVAAEAKVDIKSVFMEKPKPIEKKEKIRPTKGFANMDVDVEEMEKRLAKEVIDVETTFNTCKDTAHSLSNETINNADSEYAQTENDAEKLALKETTTSGELKVVTLADIAREQKIADDANDREVQALEKSQEDYDQAVLNLESAETIKKDELKTATSDKEETIQDANEEKTRYINNANTTAASMVLIADTNYNADTNHTLTDCQIEKSILDEEVLILDTIKEKMGKLSLGSAKNKLGSATKKTAANTAAVADKAARAALTRQLANVATGSTKMSETTISSLSSVMSSDAAANQKEDMTASVEGSILDALAYKRATFASLPCKFCVGSYFLYESDCTIFFSVL